MSGAVTHLLPSVQAVAIRAKQSQIASVCGPIAETVIPHTSPAFVPKLLGRVNMVNIENTIITFAAHDARPAKTFNQGQFSAPVAWVFVFLKAVLVPMVFTALFRAKTVFAVDAASLTSWLSFPSSRQITRPPAIFSSAIFQAVGMRFKLLLAVATSHFDRCLFHYQNILYCGEKVKFDIACKRIEQAQRQGDLFIEGAAA